MAPRALSEVEVEAISGRPSPLPKSRAQRGSSTAAFARAAGQFQFLPTQNRLVWGTLSGHAPLDEQNPLVRANLLGPRRRPDGS